MWTIEIGVDAGANSLKRQAHGFVRDSGEPFEAQDVVGADDVSNLFCKGRGVGNFGAGDDEGFEFIVAVFMCVVVMVVAVVVIIVVMMVNLVPGIEVCFGTDTLAKEDVDG